MPPRVTRAKVPSPPPDFKPGVRRDNHPPQARPDDIRKPVIRRSAGDDKPNVTPTTKAPPNAPIRRVEQPEPRKVEPPKRVEQPKQVEQPKPQPQKQAPQRKDDEEQQRGPRR